MNPQFQQVTIQAAMRSKGKTGGAPEPKNPNRYRAAKSIYRLRKTLIQNSKDAFMIIIGIASAGFGLKSFLLPNNFIDGGATGISLLLAEVTSYPLYIIILIVNIPFIILAYRQLGKWFTVKTILSVVGLALCLAFVNYPSLTNDKLLVAVFGGFFSAPESDLRCGPDLY